MPEKVIGIYGESNSGKTILVEKIIKYFSKERLNVASIKISDKKIEIDKFGKDTYKHAKAGADLVVFSTSSETDYLVKRHEDIRKIISTINKIDNYNLIIIEGANDDFTPKIRIGNIKKRKNTIFTYKENFKELINAINDKILEDKNE